MKKLGKATGSIRRARFDAISKDWIGKCEHKCNNCGAYWKHKAMPVLACHLSVFEICDKCLEFPTWKREQK
jgi:hypothetical protein